MPNGNRRKKPIIGIDFEREVLQINPPSLGEIQQVAGSWYSTAVGAAAKGLQSAVSARRRLVEAQAGNPTLEQLGKMAPTVRSRISTAYETLMGMRRR